MCFIKVVRTKIVKKFKSLQAICDFMHQYAIPYIICADKSLPNKEKFGNLLAYSYLCPLE